MDTGSDPGRPFNYLAGLINFAVVFCIVWFLWYVFMHPSGVMKLYTPMYGFALVVLFLCSIILISKVMDFYPFAESTPPDAGRLGRGIALTVLAVILMLVINYGVFWNFVGKYGVAYFSPQSIVASGGTGAEPLNARENACTAIIYFGTAFLWWALLWNVGFGRWPWVGTTRGVMAWSRLFAVLFFTILTYVLLFHPHVCYLFYPPQNKAGVEPWWSSFAGTGSAFFSLGLILCSMAWLVVSDVLWEGYPWRILEKDGQGTLLKGIVTIVGTFLLGLVTFLILLKIMNFFWMEPFEGGQYTDAPYFRFLHTGEFGGFVIVASFVLTYYFNNFPNMDNLWLRGFIRVVIAFAGGVLIRWFYYSSAASFILGKVPGIAQPDDTSLVWTILFLSVVLIQANFFGNWPLQRKTTT